MKGRALWLVGFAVIAGIAYQITIVMTPRLMMALVTAKLSKVGSVNTITHAPRSDEHQRQVVMPSPDLLYSFCVYDLSEGPLKIHADIPGETYWSLSAFDARTDNFYVIDDRDISSGAVDAVIVSNEQADTLVTTDLKIRSPSLRGVVLFRTLVATNARFEEIDAARRRSSCNAVRS